MVWCPACNHKYCGHKVKNDIIPGRIVCYCNNCHYGYEIWHWEIDKGNEGPHEQ